MGFRSAVAAVVFLALAGCVNDAGSGTTPRSATFEARHAFKVTVPDGARQVRAWFAVPQDDPAQEVRGLRVESPYPHRFVTDSEGNRVLFVEADAPRVKEFTVVTAFEVTRCEVRSGVDAARARPLTAAERTGMERHLRGDRNVVIDDGIRKLSAEIVGGESNPVVAARKLYDWTLVHIDYWVKDPKNKKASPVGSSEYCLSSRTGNCTDFHSLWTALARAQGIPTRMVYGAFFKAELDGQDVDQSYHCWPEFYAPGIGWVPHDVAVADLFADDFPLNDDNRQLVSRTTAAGYRGRDAGVVDYYFGNLEERRVTFSRGRDLILEPKQEGEPVNALAKAYVEADGQPLAEKTGWTRKLTYKEKKPD